LLYQTDHIDIAMSYHIATRDQFPKVLFKDTIATLKSLQKMGKKLGIVTATTLSSILYDFEKLQVPKKLFDYLQSEDDTAFHKPDPRVFEPTLGWLSSQQIEPGEVLYVGDHLKDMSAARGAGFQFVAVTTGVVLKSEFTRYQAKVISSLSQLLGGFL